MLRLLRVIIRWFKSLGRKPVKTRQSKPAPRQPMMSSLEDRRMLAFDLNTFSINDISILEGDAQQSLAVFTVSLFGLTTRPVSAQFETADGTGKAGVDYERTFGSVVFRIGETQKAIAIPIFGNRKAQPNRDFVVNLTSSIGLPIAKGVGQCVIVDDDQQTISIAARDATAAEAAAEAGGDVGVFRVTRAGPADEALMVKLSISGTAKNGEDYLRVKKTVTIPAGKAFAAVIIRPVDDNAPEPAETVTVKIASSPAYIIGRPKSATVTIANHDNTAPVATLTAGNIEAASANPHQFVVQYSDSDAIDRKSIGAGDIQVTGPNGFLQLAGLVSKTADSTGGTIVAVYRVTPPGKGWDAADNGVYTVTVLPNQVKDKAGNFVAGGVIGVFNVNVPA